MMDDCSIELVLKIASLFPFVYQAAVKQITEVFFSQPHQELRKVKSSKYSDY